MVKFARFNGDLSEWLKEFRCNRKKVSKGKDKNRICIYNWRLVRVVEGVPMQSEERE